MKVKQENILFDLWGILVHSNAQTNVGAELQRITGLGNKALDRIIEEYWFKSPISLKQYVTILAWAARLDDENEKALSRLLKVSSDSAVVYDDVFPSLKRLSENHHLYLISDCGSTGRAVIERLGLSQRFQEVFLSNEQGATKATDLYQMLLMRARKTAENCAVLGDSLTADYDIPRALGMHPLLLDRRGTKGDYEK